MRAHKLADFETFQAEALKKDAILLLNLGTDDVFATTPGGNIKDHVFAARRPHFLKDTWVEVQRQAAPRLRAFLARLAAGRNGRVWWRGHTPLCGNKYGSRSSPRYAPSRPPHFGAFREAPIGELNEKLRRSSYLISEQLCDWEATSTGAAESVLRVVDAWRWTVAGGGTARPDGEHCAYYPDFVHHPPLAEQQVSAVIDDMLWVL